MKSLTIALLLATATTQRPPDVPTPTPDFTSPNKKKCDTATNWSETAADINMDKVSSTFTLAASNLKLPVAEEDCFKLCAAWALRDENACCQFTAPDSADATKNTCNLYTIGSNEVVPAPAVADGGAATDSAWGWGQY